MQTPVLPQRFLDLARSQVMAVGSRVTCSPPPADTDADYLVYAGEDRAKTNRILINSGWEYGGSIDPRWEAGDFDSYRKGEFNLIVAFSKDFHRKFVAATAIAKRLNVLDKPDRIALFRAVMSAEVCS